MERLPFGGRHADSSANLSTMVPGRFVQNRRAHREIARSADHQWHRERSGLITRRMTIPIDGTKIEELFKYITKALMWHHWKVELGDDVYVEAIIPNFALIRTFVGLLRANAAQRVTENVGLGTFMYAGAQGLDNPVHSVWEFAIYGGLDLSGGGTNEVVSRIYGMTSPMALKQKADARVRSRTFIIRP
jgi:hypothetical protein